jgi:hypothetical protein
MSDDGLKIKTIHEGENFSIYRVEDSDGEIGYDLNLFDTVTVHFVEDEWNELLAVLDQVARKS